MGVSSIIIIRTDMTAVQKKCTAFFMKKGRLLFLLIKDEGTGKE